MLILITSFNYDFDCDKLVEKLVIKEERAIEPNARTPNNA